MLQRYQIPIATPLLRFNSTAPFYKVVLYKHIFYLLQLIYLKLIESSVSEKLNNICLNEYNLFHKIIISNMSTYEQDT